MHWSFVALLLSINTLTTLADSSSIFTQSSNDSLLWGPYRSNLYFGLRARQPNSLTTGLLWGRVEDYRSIPHNVRFTCEQHSGMDSYGWDFYDPRSGGVQTIRDHGNGVDLETGFVKFEDGAWGARVIGTVREDAEPGIGSQNGVKEELKSTVLFTVSSGGVDGVLEAKDADASEESGFEGDLVLTGRDAGLGDFTLTITAAENNSHPVHNHASYASKPLDHTFVHSVQVPEEALWQGKALTFGSMKTTIDAYVAEYTEEHMPPPWQTYTIQNRPGKGNSHIIQKVFEGNFEFDIFYTTATITRQPTSADLTKRIYEVVTGINEKFQKTFAPQPPFNKDKKYFEFGRNLFSNLIGGIGYFHGDHLVDRSNAPEYLEENEQFHLETAEARSHNTPISEGPHELFTAVPSRPFFPRGFLWDEGFHLLPVVDWDSELVMQIIRSWFNLMDDDGWIPREVILGSEARSKVPPEFQTQFPHYANPPTLFMTLEALLEKVEREGDVEGTDLLKNWLRELYPLLQRNWEWYRRTQFGDLKNYDHGDPPSMKEAYRWRGRSEQHILTSGLDDYPRAQPPHPGELHLDLISWMGMMTRSLSRVAAFLEEREDAETYAKTLTSIRKNIDYIHWNAKNKTYCDVSIDEDFEESKHVCHKGYIAIFPFMTGLMGPEHEHLGAVLELIGNKNELWSPFGVRSLSLSDELFGTGENYWRGPIWINMNYLIVDNLLAIASQPGPHKTKATQMYTALRKILVDTVYNSWLETGFAWEQYNPQTGKGQRTQHFTGWTSLVVKIMAMPEEPGMGSAKSPVTKTGGSDEL